MSNDSAFILAWPDTLVAQVGSWYDYPMRWINFNRNRYYKVGHAAIVLINHKNGNLHYFDFGRYHTPLKKGRVRDKDTDPDLTIHTSAKFSTQGTLINTQEILEILANNPATHGTGKLIATHYVGLDFNKAFLCAKKLQEKDAIHYGPFDMRGTNCSRFVAFVLKKSDIKSTTRLKLSLIPTLTPTPLSNIKKANSMGGYYQFNEGKLSFIRIK